MEVETWISEHHLYKVSKSMCNAEVPNIIHTQLPTQTLIPLMLEPLIISITSDLAPTLVNLINIIEVKIQ